MKVDNVIPAKAGIHVLRFPIKAFGNDNVPSYFLLLTSYFSVYFTNPYNINKSPIIRKNK